MACNHSFRISLASLGTSGASEQAKCLQDWITEDGRIEVQGQILVWISADRCS